MGSGFSKKKKQMKMFQEQMQKMQEEMSSLEVVGSASSMVEITLKGDHTVKSVKINPDCVDKDAVDALEDLVHTALAEALQKLEEQGKPDLGGMGLGGLGGLGF